jgi:hypothetical protein
MLIYKLIPMMMADLGAVKKERKNDAQGYMFRGIEDFLQAVHPVMVKHGVFCTPEVIECTTSEVRKQKNGSEQVSFRVLLRINHRFYAHDGSYVTVTTEGEGIDQSDKSSNKAMSAGLKYALIGLFSIPTKDIEDADRSDSGMSQKSEDFTNYAQTTVNQPNIDSLKEFVVSVGGDRSAIKGKKFKDIAIDVLMREANGAFDWFQKQGKEIPPAWLTFFTNVEQYTGSKIGVR